MIEIMLGTSIMVIVLVAMLGSFFGQSTLNANSRNMMAAMNDATRVMEEIRRQNATSLVGSSCAAQSNIPSARPPASSTNWNAWLNAQTPAKSVTTNNLLELVAVTCQDQDGGNQTSDYCRRNPNNPNNPAQVGSQEWRTGGTSPTTFDPIRVTVSVGWWAGRRGQGLAFGSSAIPGMDFNYNPWTKQVYTGPDVDNDGVIESPAMLTTLVTCR